MLAEQLEMEPTEVNEAKLYMHDLANNSQAFITFFSYRL